MNNWFKVNVNEVLCTGLSNSELGIMIRYKALCEHFGVDNLTWQKIEFNFDCKERKVVSKLFGILPEVSPDMNQSSPEVEPKLVGSLTEVSPKFTRSSPEVCPKKGSRIKDLKNPYNIYNIYNNTIQDKTRQDNVPTCSVKQAERLAEIIQKRKNVKIDNRKISAWAKSLSMLERIDGVDTERIDKVLDWYSSHYGEDYVPVAESGATLREKFLRIEAAMQRDGGTNTEKRDENGLREIVW